MPDQDKVNVSEQMGVASPDVQTKKKREHKAGRSTGWIIAVVILSLAVLGLAGFLTYHLLVTDTRSEEKECETICETTDGDDAGSGEVKPPVSTIKDDEEVREIAGKLYDVAVKTVYDGESFYPNLVHTYNEMMPLYKPEGLKTSTKLILSYGFGFVGDSSEFEKKSRPIFDGRLKEALVAELGKNGFVEYEYRPTFATEYINQELGIVCALSSAGMPFGVGCSSVKWYSTEDWEFINDLAEAFKEKKGEYPYYLKGNPKQVEDSGYEQYQKIHVSLADAGASFYRVNPESEWKFFRDGQDAGSCEEYNTEELRKAFIGETCWYEANGKTGVVKP